MPPSGGGGGGGGPQRVLDPVVLQAAAAGRNYSGQAAHGQPGFAALWHNHSSAPPPASGGGGGGGGGSFANLVRVLGPALGVEPLQRGRCAGDCIGTNMLGDCVCYAAE